MARGAADIEALSVIEDLSPCFWLSVIIDIIIWSLDFDSVHGFLCLMHSISMPVAITLNGIDVYASI